MKPLSWNTVFLGIVLLVLFWNGITITHKTDMLEIRHGFNLSNWLEIHHKGR